MNSMGQRYGILCRLIWPARHLHICDDVHVASWRSASRLAFAQQKLHRNSCIVCLLLFVTGKLTLAESAAPVQTYASTCFVYVECMWGSTRLGIWSRHVGSRRARCDGWHRQHGQGFLTANCVFHSHIHVASLLGHSFPSERAICQPHNRAGSVDIKHALAKVERPKKRTSKYSKCAYLQIHDECS